MVTAFMALMICNFFPISDVSLSFLNTSYLFKSIPVTSSSEGLLCLGAVLGIGM